MDDSSEDWTDIGSRIRAAREAAGVSVRELGRRVGVSPSHISQVERGLGSFSVSALYSVASQLQISLDSLFDAPPPSAMRHHAEGPPSPLDGVLVLRATDRPAIKLKSGPRWERLTVDSEPDAEFLEVIYEPSAAGEEPEFSRHEGVEYGVIVSGVLSVQVGFDTAVLYPGDSIRLDSSQPHRYWNAGSAQVRAIWFESRGERASAGSRVPGSAPGHEH
jgi:transcriptional regulator with XRE-family HTH domain